MKPYTLIIIMLSFVFCFGCVSQGPKQIVTIENETLRVGINKQGAELWSIYGKTDGAEYLWQGDAEYWSGRAPIMFPVNVCFKDERFTYKGEMYDMPRMGLAKDTEFELGSSASPDAVTFRFASNSNTLKHYPFPFCLQVEYRLKGNKLINVFEIKNTGTETMYFALGGHPGFSCPFEEGLGRGDYQIVFSEKRSLKRIKVEDSLVHPETLTWLNREDRFKLDDTRIPNGGMFHRNTPFEWIGVGRAGRKPFVRVELGNFPNVNIWTPPGYPFVCIEPMVSHHDILDSPVEIENKTHLVGLPSGNHGLTSFQLSLRT